MHNPVPALPDFLEKYRITQAQFDAARLTWDELLQIQTDFSSRTAELSEIAGFIARNLQLCPEVHSVRWRLKDPWGLVAKVIRKRNENPEKYAALNSENYDSLVTDLIGLRALHLFKADWKPIHEFILRRWEQVESPVAYVRQGDSLGQGRDAYTAAGCAIENHAAGYRSVHYIIGSRPNKHLVTAEVQVRTLFEEGWSEIDHRVRYPNLSSNPLISGFLDTFNRIAGAADEMGSFVELLASRVHAYEAEVNDARESMSSHMSKIEELTRELTNEREHGHDTKRRLAELQSEVSSLRLSMSLDRPQSAGLRRVRRDAAEAAGLDTSLTDSIADARRALSAYEGAFVRSAAALTAEQLEAMLENRRRRK